MLWFTVHTFPSTPGLHMITNIFTEQSTHVSRNAAARQNNVHFMSVYTADKMYCTHFYYHFNSISSQVYLKKKIALVYDLAPNSSDLP